MSSSGAPLSGSLESFSSGSNNIGFSSDAGGVNVNEPLKLLSEVVFTLHSILLYALYHTVMNYRAHTSHCSNLYLVSRNLFFSSILAFLVVPFHMPFLLVPIYVS